MERKDCPNKELNERDCPCTHDECERHGVCCLCVRFHLGRGEKPACVR